MFSQNFLYAYTSCQTHPLPKFPIGARIACKDDVYYYEGEVLGYCYTTPNNWTEDEGYSYIIFCEVLEIEGELARGFCPVQADLKEGNCIRI